RGEVLGLDGPGAAVADLGNLGMYRGAELDAKQREQQERKGDFIQAGCPSREHRIYCRRRWWAKSEIRQCNDKLPQGVKAPLELAALRYGDPGLKPKATSRALSRRLKWTAGDKSGDTRGVAEEACVLDEDAAVHDDVDACLLGLDGGGLVDDSEL